MKILNKKGVTIVEIVISIALISLVMIFLFRVLVSLTNDQNERIDTNANILASTIIKAIETDIIERDLIGIIICPEAIKTHETRTKTDNTILYFEFADGDTDSSYKELIVNNGSIKYWNGQEKENHKIKDFIKVSDTSLDTTTKINTSFHFDMENLEFSTQEFLIPGTNVYDGFINIRLPFTDDEVTYVINIPIHYRTDRLKIYHNSEKYVFMDDDTPKRDRTVKFSYYKQLNLEIE